jgi:hypothetical protein
MTVPRLDSNLTREQLLLRLADAEHDVEELLEQAAQLTSDLEERQLFERLAERERASVQELRDAEERLLAEEFVQKALDV